ncbi:hypothetical protein V6N12_054583 [Hibiscus sabdariffa]|uniref:S-locus glycoprotein n=1 Tax=Hibiscus sabdariffa TaxID=183260 RepID=A0ABR2D1M2_9ROSI
MADNGDRSGLIIFSKASTAIHTISSSESLRDGRTLVSDDGTFALGFFSPGSTCKNRYLGIWYNNIPMQNVAWVANRVNPINGSTGVLKIENSGRIVLQVQNSMSVWSSNTTASVQNPVLQLLDSGNLVVRDGSDTKYLRSGLWNGNDFSGHRNLRWNPIFDYDFVNNENEVYYVQFLKNKSEMTRGVLNQTESLRQRFTWNPETQTWQLIISMPIDNCDKYGTCGPNGNCDTNKFLACYCLTGFRPKWPEIWNSSDWTGGCVHSKPLNCQSGDGFIGLRRVKTPENTNSWVNETMNLKECRAKCLSNCSCTAYTNVDVTRGGSGCAIWFRDLIDIKQFQSNDGQDLYIRVSASGNCL